MPSLQNTTVTKCKEITLSCTQSREMCIFQNIPTFPACLYVVRTRSCYHSCCKTPHNLHIEERKQTVFKETTLSIIVLEFIEVGNSAPLSSFTGIMASLQFINEITNFTAFSPYCSICEPCLKTSDWECEVCNGFLLKKM